MVRDDTIMHQYRQYIFRGDPERAPNTRGTGSNFFMYIYIYIVRACVCGVRDHFSQERVKFLTCKVMVVMRMLIRPHCTINLRDTQV